MLYNHDGNPHIFRRNTSGSHPHPHPTPPHPTPPLSQVGVDVTMTQGTDPPPPSSPKARACMHLAGGAYSVHCGRRSKALASGSASNDVVIMLTQGLTSLMAPPPPPPPAIKGHQTHNQGQPIRENIFYIFLTRQTPVGIRDNISYTLDRNDDPAK